MSITIPFDPEEHHGLGWIWDADADALGEGGWRPCVAWLPDGKETVPLLRLICTDSDGDTDEEVLADDWDGAPYIAALEPACDPGVAAMACVWLPGGGVMTLTQKHDACAKAMIDAMVAVARGETVRSDTYAARDVLAERARQIREEGWTPEHDDQHVHGELAAAATCYVVPSRDRLETYRLFWPPTWAKEYWKPAGAHDNLAARRRDLVRGLALGLAEIERIDRLTARQTEGSAALNGEGGE